MSSLFFLLCGQGIKAKEKNGAHFTSLQRKWVIFVDARPKAAQVVSLPLISLCIYYACYVFLYIR